MTKPIIITELPFAFWVADRQDNPALYIVDPDKRYNQRLNFYIENTAGQTLFFGPTQLEAKPPSAGHCHFELRFRRGVLADASLGTSTYKGLEKKSIELLLTGKYQKRAYDIGSWVISAPDDHGGEKPYVSFYLARAEKGSGGRFLPGERLRLVLTNISASPEEGSAETRIELVPHNIFYGPPLQEGSAPVVEPREQNVLVINHTGKEHIPLHLAFIGNYTVRNDGQAQGEGHLLRLRITNTSRHDTISFNEKSRMLFTFDHADGDQEEEIGKPGDVSRIRFYLNRVADEQELSIHPQMSQNPVWNLGVDQELHTLNWEPHQHWDILLDTSDFITHSPAGLTPLHITYEDIPGYWDGKLHTAVEKTPLIVRKGAGIHGHISKETVEMDSGNRTLYLMGNDRDGSANDHARLHVMGRTFVDGKLVATGETQLRGKVGIGTSNPPQEALEVAGRIKDKTGYVMPVGAVIAFGGKLIPDGWLECNGQEISRVKFPELVEVLTNSKTVMSARVPDLLQRFIVGAAPNSRYNNYSLNSKGGEERVKLITAELPSHSHTSSISTSRTLYKKTKTNKTSFKDAVGQLSMDMGLGGSSKWKYKTLNYIYHHSESSEYSSHSHSVTIGSAGNNRAHNNLPPYYALRYIIKY
jgi:microcystin-dependent protein